MLHTANTTDSWVAIKINKTVPCQDANSHQLRDEYCYVEGGEVAQPLLWGVGNQRSFAGTSGLHPEPGSQRPAARHDPPPHQRQGRTSWQQRVAAGRRRTIYELEDDQEHLRQAGYSGKE